MAEFPQLHWKTIDGENVPFTEPQHFVGEGDEVVRTGDKNPLPTKDKEVLTELESIKAENEEIKQKQADIIKALQSNNESLKTTNQVLESVIKDGNINAQLTGSNVELAKAENFKIPAGSSYEVLFETHTYIGVGITTLELYFGFLKEENIRVDLDHYISGDRYALIKKENKIIEGENIQRDVIRTKAYGDGWRVRMFNLSNEEVEFFLFGVKGLFI